MAAVSAHFMYSCRKLTMVPRHTALIAVGMAYAILGALQHARADRDEELPSCGVACVYGALRLVGQPIPLREVESRCRALRPDLEKDGLSLAELGPVVQGLGLYAQAVRVTGPHATLPMPAILYTRPERLARDRVLGHYVLLCSADRAGAYVADLSAGRRAEWISRQDLFANWDGELLAISKEPFGMARRYQRAIAWTILACVFVACSACWLCVAKSCRGP